MEDIGLIRFKKYLTPVEDILTDEQQREELSTWKIRDLWYQLPDSTRRSMDENTEKDELIEIIIDKGYYQCR